ncbi:MAG: sulfate respiration complex protein HmcE [Pseudomonadota bacterium]
MYNFLTGPGLWLSMGICLIGLFVRGVMYVKGLSWQLDRVAYTAHPKAGIKGALRSIFFWIIPFGTRGWRAQPFMTVLCYTFHVGAVGVPLFLAAHNMILKEKMGFSFFIALNQKLADILSWGVVISAAFLMLRRIALPEVRILTTMHDYAVLLLSVAPFITGLICRYQWGDASFWLPAHIFCGEILLIAVPFTKLSHILLFFMSRAQLGMDFGIKRGGLKGKGIAW